VGAINWIVNPYGAWGTTITDRRIGLRNRRRTQPENA
jgi:hypothetical protein